MKNEQNQRTLRENEAKTRGSGEVIPEPNLSQAYSGSMRMADGSRVALTSAEAEALWHGVEAAKAKRAADLPDDAACLRAMMDAYSRLRDLGWADAMYAPKDGSAFEAITIGSSGIFRCHFSIGSFWIEDSGDLWPSDPAMFRLYPADAERRKQRMADAAKAYAADAARAGTPGRSPEVQAYIDEERRKIREKRRR